MQTTDNSTIKCDFLPKFTHTRTHTHTLTAAHCNHFWDWLVLCFVCGSCPYEIFKCPELSIYAISTGSLFVHLPVSLALSLSPTASPYSQTAHSCPFQPHHNPFCCPSRIRYPFHWKTNCKCLRLAWLRMYVCGSVFLCVPVCVFAYASISLLKIDQICEAMREGGRNMQAVLRGGGMAEQRDWHRETIKQRRIKANKLVTFTSHTQDTHTRTHTQSHSVNPQRKLCF